MDSLLRVEDLNVVFDTFDGTSRVLRNISLNLKESESLGLVGESGCGKSVLSLSMMRIIPVPGRIASGAIWFKGRNLAAAAEREMERVRGSEIAMILQSPMTSLNPVFMVKDQMVDVIRRHSPMKPREAENRAVDLLDLVRIPDPRSVLRKYPFELSGGMSQRVMIAMAVSSNPSLLIADEPTTALDVTVEKQIMKLIGDLRSEFGTSLIWISHDLGVVRQVCERIAVMYAGTVVEVGPTDAILDRPKHPYTQALIDAIPSRRQRGQPLREITGLVPNLLHVPAGCVFSDRCDQSQDICRTGRSPELIEIEHGRRIACHFN